MCVCVGKREEADIPSHRGLLPCESAMCSVKILPSGPMSSHRARGMNVARQLRTPPTRHDLLPSFLIVSRQEQQRRSSLIQRERCMYGHVCFPTQRRKRNRGIFPSPCHFRSWVFARTTCVFLNQWCRPNTHSRRDTWLFRWPVFYFVYNKASLKYPPPAALGKLGQLTVSEDDKLTCCLAEK